MSMNYEPLDTFLSQYNVYPSTFGPIREQFKEKYGEHGWIGKFVTASRGLTPADGRKYESARKQVERWNAFERTGKYNPDRAKAEGRAQIEKAGRTLEPVGKNAPAGGISLTIDFYDPAEGGRGRRKERSTPTLHMDHATAQQYINQARPDYTFLFDLWGNKKVGTNLWGEDGPYPADVTKVS